MSEKSKFGYKNFQDIISDVTLPVEHDPVVGKNSKNYRKLRNWIKAVFLQIFEKKLRLTGFPRFPSIAFYFLAPETCSAGNFTRDIGF